MKKTYFILIISLLFSSCDIINPSEDIPAFLYIEPFQLTTNAAFEGTNSEKITEVWVFVGTDFTGAYTLPAIVPILETGERSIILQAGIKDNGVSSLPEIYPFYESATFDMTLVPGQTDTLQPKTSYIQDIVFSFIEGFEDANHIFTDDIDGNPETNLVSSNEEVFEGNRSGKIFLNQDNPTVQIGTSVNQLFSGLQDKGAFIYLEVNYKSDVAVSWGIAVHPESSFDRALVYDPGFLAKEEWNKIYFNLSQLVFDNQNAQYQIILGAQLPIQDGAFSLEEATIYLDNIKLVHF